MWRFFSFSFFSPLFNSALPAPSRPDRIIQKKGAWPLLLKYSLFFPTRRNCFFLHLFNHTFSFFILYYLAPIWQPRDRREKRWGLRVMLHTLASSCKVSRALHTRVSHGPPLFRVIHHINRLRGFFSSREMTIKVYIYSRRKQEGYGECFFSLSHIPVELTWGKRKKKDEDELVEFIGCTGQRGVLTENLG